MIAIGYVRVSTDKQDNSADAQEKRISAQATAKGFELLRVISDIDEFSGDLDRPGAQELMELVRTQKIDAVIITKLDRLTRSVRDALDLAELFEKHHVAFIAIDDSIDTKSPMGEFFFTLMAALGQLERRLIGSRTSAGLQNIKSQGFPAGPAPYGYKSQKRTEKEKADKIRKLLLEDPHEQNILARIKELHAKELTWPAIAIALNREGYRTRSGGKWQYQAVHRIFNKVILKRQ